MTRRGEIWSLADGGRLLILQTDLLNEELPTTVGVVVTTTPQLAPPPLRVALPAADTSLDHDVWAKTNLVRTVPAEDVHRRLGLVSDAALERVGAAVSRVLRLADAR